jgi:hypothetical protein
MRLTPFAILTLLVVVDVASAKEIWLSIGGTTPNGTFRTDARIFNPSATKDIQIQAYYLPVGNIDNSAVQPLSITIPKRQMAVYNDVVASLFHSGGLGAIRLTSADDFVATQRIYAVSSSGLIGTLGQFVGGVDSSSAKAKGVLIQLQVSGTSGQTGTFRTNVGAANPNATTANVTWRLHDKNNNLVGNPRVTVMPSYAVIGPSTLGGFADALPAGADLSDAWLSYVSDQPIIAYGSVIDNGTSDPTYIPTSEDTGQDPSGPPSDISGTWTGTRTYEYMITNPPDSIDCHYLEADAFSLNQSGSGVSGSLTLTWHLVSGPTMRVGSLPPCASDSTCHGPVTGSISGAAIQLSFDQQACYADATSFVGTVNGSTMNGTNQPNPLVVMPGSRTITELFQPWTVTR